MALITVDFIVVLCDKVTHRICGEPLPGVVFAFVLFFLVEVGLLVNPGGIVALIGRCRETFSALEKLFGEYKSRFSLGTLGKSIWLDESSC